MDRRDRDFEKRLAKINAHLTIITTASSVFALFGISLFILGATAGLDALSKTGDELTFVTIVGNLYSKVGIGIFTTGMIILVIAQYKIPNRIDNL